MSATLEQTIRTIFREELHPFKKELILIKDEVSFIKKDLASVKGEVAFLKKAFTSLKDEMSTLKKDLTSFKKEFTSFKVKTLAHQKHFDHFKTEVFTMLGALKEAQEKTQAELSAFKLDTGKKFDKLFQRTAFFDHNLNEMTKEIAASKRDIEKLKFNA
ncbi:MULTISPECIES: hypothetical protein [Bacillus]|uniref:Uncharacterized protein n=1 Tax=Bacillus glycinifermentans TaxID=1664069 RepID=A0AAJ3YWM8_9BACI|nr:MULTISPECIES: hypothetical protein [Bacillus]KKB73613.1 hypothetical protein TH62_11490 [Bacillus sp. TH008]MDU0072436.1 hypothetical protein [Bacillus sp. IG6]MED8020229.1 hypothetical protein [Bacillus glycinifermentans]QAT64306.1 hypothetical protein EQZ20_04785 [Bacillus glycinifermentans]WKB78212.1 hypothetical protein QYM22_04890 [Bacillus glycinifermentans]